MQLTRPRFQCTLALLLTTFLLVATTHHLVLADESTHNYVESEDVLVYANKMGPFNNPLETYAYFELPGCPPANWEHKFPSLGQALVGDELYQMKTAIKFKQDIASAAICDFTPKRPDDVERWKEMIEAQYWYQLYIDGLPVWASFGRMVNGDTPQIYTHQAFTLGYNGEHLVFANLSVSNLAPLPTADAPSIKFTYSVNFIESKVAFEDRFRRYLDNSFFEHRIHWFSIFNSFMMVLFLSGMVVMILSRTLKNDFARFAAAEKDETEYGPSSDWTEEAGWKQLRGDVFRVPPRPALLCACIGTGWQLCVLTFCIILVAIVSVVYQNPGSLLTYGVLAFAVTSFVAGHTSATHFLDFAQISPGIAPQWTAAMLLTASLFPGSVLALGFLLNWIAIFYDSAQAIPFGGMIVMLLLWLVVSAPLVVLGTIVGRHRRSPGGTARPDVPHVNQVPRIVPERPWYLQRRSFIIAGGILPFGSIFIELYFVLTAFWNYKLYYVYGFLLLVCVILVIVTACVAIVSAYILLSGEEHKWPWTVFCLGASVGVYVFIYSAYFYLFKTRMSGFFMFCFYFGYMGMMCFGISLLCGAVAYTATRRFIVMIYRAAKSE